jgi:AcrR family transcriptional regulator
MARLTREESRERTRERLLEAAREAVARNGYDGTSVADIAEAAGFSKGAFFSNFESKEALLLELLRRHKEQDIATLERILDGAEQGDAGSALDRYFKDRGGDAVWARLDIELLLHAARNPAFAADYDALQSRTRSRLAHLIAALFDKAGKRAPAPPGDLADLFAALVHGLVLQRARDPGASVKLVFESLMAKAEPA